MNRNLTTIFFSPTDNTKVIVNSIAKGMGFNTAQTVYDLTLPENRKLNIGLKNNEIVIVGVPVYGGRIPEFLVPIFNDIKGSGNPTIFVVVYGNRDYEDSLLELKDIFEGNGFIGIAAGAFIGEHSNTRQVATGRPDNLDLEAAERFGKEIAEKLQKQVLNRVEVKGGFPYKERKMLPDMVPDTDENCINCGICAKYCPTAAINPLDVKEVDKEKCIHCSSCVKRCPVNAKSFKHQVFLAITEGLIKNCTQIRREPELWF